jgi:hypothetical protein
MSVKTSSDITYTEQYGSHSSPLFVKLNPINNLQTANLSLTATYGPVEILVPAKTLNLSRSKLSFDLAVPAQAASTFGYIQANALCLFDRITLTSQNTNQVLCDISNFNRYASMLSPILTTQAEIQNKASPILAGALYTSAATGQAFPLEDVSRPNTVANLDGNAVEYGNPYGICVRKTFVSTATATANYVSFEMDLASIHASIFDIDKLIYASGEQLLLSLYFSPVNRFSWGGTSSSDPTTGAIAATGTYTFSNLALYLYTENNLDISSSLVNKVMSEGMAINFPYSYVQRQAVASGAWSINQQLSRGFGSKLLLVATSIFNPTETNRTAQDHSVQHLSTAAGGSYSSFIYNTFIDNIPIQTNNNIAILSNGVSGGEHWLYNKGKLKGSAISSLINYNVDFCHLDVFTDVPLPGIDWTIVDGLSLDAQHQWGIVSSSVAGASVNNNIYIIFVCQKKLMFSPTGLQVV